VFEGGLTSFTSISRAGAQNGVIFCGMAGFTSASLFAALVVSSVGLGLAGYGKKMARLPQLVVGLLLLVYPYFVTAVVPMIIVAVVLLAVMALAIARGH
jgi:hypothetical protein